MWLSHSTPYAIDALNQTLGYNFTLEDFANDPTAALNVFMNPRIGRHVEEINQRFNVGRENPTDDAPHVRHITPPQENNRPHQTDGGTVPVEKRNDPV